MFLLVLKWLWLTVRAGPGRPGTRLQQLILLIAATMCSLMVAATAAANPEHLDSAESTRHLSSSGRPSPLELPVAIRAHSRQLPWLYRPGFVDPAGEGRPIMDRIWNSTDRLPDRPAPAATIPKKREHHD